MKVRKQFLTMAAITMAALGLSTGTATASASASSRIELRGTVPLICRYEVNSSVVSVQNGTADFGAVEQFCNSGSGYVFAVHHSPEFHGLFIVDGRAVPASETGTTILERSNAPTAGAITLRVEKMEPGAAPALSLSMLANG